MQLWRLKLYNILKSTHHKRNSCYPAKSISERHQHDTSALLHTPSGRPVQNHKATYTMIFTNRLTTSPMQWKTYKTQSNKLSTGSKLRERKEALNCPTQVVFSLKLWLKWSNWRESRRSYEKKRVGRPRRSRSEGASRIRNVASVKDQSPKLLWESRQQKEVCVTWLEAWPFATVRRHLMKMMLSVLSVERFLLLAPWVS